MCGGGNPLSAVTDAISDLGSSVGDAVSGIGDTISDVVIDPIKDNWVDLRDTAQAAAVVAGNYYLPGSSLLTSQLVTEGAQERLDSDLGKVANLAAGATGGYQGNLSNYGKIGEAIGLTDAAASGVTAEQLAAANATGDPIAALNAIKGFTGSDLSYLSTIAGMTPEILAAGSLGAAGGTAANSIANAAAGGAGAGAAGLGAGAAAAAAGAAGGNALLNALIAGTVGSAISGIAGADAAKSAAQTQADAAKAAQDQQLAMFNTINAQQAPYRAAGYGALGNLGALGTGTYQMYDAQGKPTGMGTGSGYLQKQFDASDLAKGLAPNYDFMLEQGQKANLRAANMAGGGLGGNALQGLQKYTQDYAGNAYQNAFNNFQAQRGNIYNTLAGIAGIGQTGQTATNTAATNATNAATQLGIGSAAAQAAGTIGSTNAYTGAINNALNNYTLASLLGQGGRVA
jgi:hypothetical protein